MGATDDSTRFHYLELLQHHKALPGTEAAGVRNAEYPVSRSLDTQVNGKPVPVGVLEGTSGRTSLKDKAKAVAARIKRDLKKLLTKSDPVADTVRVELGNSQARQKSLFEVKYPPSDVNALKMQAAAQTKKAPTRYGHLRKREQALNTGQDADTLIDKQINETLIVSYLLDTSDRARFKQIVCRYRHLEHDDDRHVVHTIPVDGYGKRTGTAITAMALHNVRESLDVMYDAPRGRRLQRAAPRRPTRNTVPRTSRLQSWRSGASTRTTTAGAPASRSTRARRRRRPRSGRRRRVPPNPSARSSSARRRVRRCSSSSRTST